MQKKNQGLMCQNQNIHYPTMHHDASVCMCCLCMYVLVNQRKKEMLNKCF